MRKGELTRRRQVDYDDLAEAIGDHIAQIGAQIAAVEALIAELTEHNPVLQKIKAGEAVSDEDANALAALLHEEHPHVTGDEVVLLDCRDEVAATPAW